MVTELSHDVIGFVICLYIFLLYNFCRKFYAKKKYAKASLNKSKTKQKGKEDLRT